METENMQNILKEYGLSEKEAKVYLATLMLGTSKVNEIAGKSNILRETTYAILKQLKEKGLVGYLIKSGVKYFNATDPEKLIEILDEKKSRIREIMKELKELKGTGIEKSKVEFYDGVEGLKTASEDMIKKENKTVRSYLVVDFLKYIPFYHPGFRLRRKEKKVFLRAICEKSTASEEFKKLDKKELREIRYMDKLMKGLNSGFYVYEDKCLFIKANEKEQFGIIIQDKEFAELQRRIYENLWKIAK